MDYNLQLVIYHQSYHPHNVSDPDVVAKLETIPFFLILKDHENKHNLYIYLVIEPLSINLIKVPHWMSKNDWLSCTGPVLTLSGVWRSYLINALLMSRHTRNRYIHNFCLCQQQSSPFAAPLNADRCYHHRSNIHRLLI